MRRLTHLFVALLVLVVSACGDGGTGPEPKEKEKIEKPVDLRFDDQTVSEAELYAAADSSLLGSGRFTLTREKGTNLAAYTAADGYKTQEVTIRFQTPDVYPISLQKTDPDRTTLHLTAAEPATFTLTRDGREDSTLATDTKEAQVGIPFGTEGQVCGQAAYKEKSCQALVANKQSVSLSFELKAKKVAVSLGDITTDDGSELRDLTVTVDDYTFADGESEHGFPAKDGERNGTIFAAGTDTVNVSFPADSDYTLDTELAVLPECSNGLDDNNNDLADENDPGCAAADSPVFDPAHPDWIYDPTDTRENLLIDSRIFSGESNIKVSISGESGDRRRELNSSFLPPFPESIQHSVRIRIRVNTLTEADETGEAWALRLRTGPTDSDLETVYTSDVVEDDGTDGWSTVVFNIPNDAFERGTEYEIIALHATKVRGEEPTDGEDEVIFALPNPPEVKGKTVIEWVFEGEDVE